MSNPLTGRAYFSTKFSNLSVVPNCDSTEDGSLEITGSVYTNLINRYSPSNVGVYIENLLLSSGTINVPQNVNVSGGLSVLSTSNLLGNVSILSTQNSSNYTSGGALTILGGASVAKNLYANLIISPFSSISNIIATNITTTNLSVNIGRFTFVSSSNLYSNFGTINNLYSFNNTSGHLNVDGTVTIKNSVGNSLIVQGSQVLAGSLFVSNVNMTPSPEDIFNERFFSINNNQSIPLNITNFLFTGTITRFFHSFVSVFVNTTFTELDSTYELKGVKNSSSGWILNTTFIGDKISIQFYINTSGQIQYTTGNIPNWISGNIKFRALTISS
jgi:hypothetical protein